MAKYRFLRFLLTDVAWHRRRFSSTAAARNQPVVSSKTGKRIPKAERKAMVYDYVNKYRMKNAGKFPGVKDTKNQVGGSFYTIRDILQELKHNSHLSAVMTADNSSVEKRAAQSNDVSAVTEILDSVTPLHKIVDSEKYGDFSKNGISSLAMMDNDSSKRTLTSTRDASLDGVCVNPTTIDSGLESHVDKACCGPMDTRHVKSKKVLKEQRLVEKTSPEIILMESTMEDFKLCEKSGLPSEGSGTSCSVFSEREKASAQDAEPTMMIVLDPAIAKKQDDGSMLPAGEIIKETSIMGQAADADEISEASETLDRQVTMDRTTIVDNGGVSDETCLTSHEKLKTSHCQMNVDNSGITNRPTTTEVVSESDTIIDLKFERTSDVGVDKARSRIVFDKSNLVKGSADESVKVSETENSQFCENRSSSFEVVGGDSDTRSGDAMTTSPPASKTDGYSRETTTPKTREKELQGTLWGNLKSMASKFIDIWRKT
ncbi:hypothetical protein RND81_08G012100 [Saponaria officinalis]|uniref:AT3G52170-like helix-turn-helix domain-containing protein n=2 Tax=Saponaria officinalis TaxID=3572 RepID=A0AAW1J2H9_SAPOF